MSNNCKHSVVAYNDLSYTLPRASHSTPGLRASRAECIIYSTAVASTLPDSADPPRIPMPISRRKGIGERFWKVAFARRFDD